jgi:hypothetical protein
LKNENSELKKQNNNYEIRLAKFNYDELETNFLNEKEKNKKLIDLNEIITTEKNHHIDQIKINEQFQEKNLQQQIANSILSNKVLKLAENEKKMIESIKLSENENYRLIKENSEIKAAAAINQIEYINKSGK